MASRCIVCKKELPEDSKLPICEYHKGVAVERVKQVGTAAAALGVGVLVERFINNESHDPSRGITGRTRRGEEGVSHGCDHHMPGARRG